MNEEVLQEAINDICNGSAVCFVGAGFSWGATDSQGKPVPSAGDLSAEICTFPGLEDEADAPLMDLAEFCDDDPALKHMLITHLINRLTLCVPSQAHIGVMQMPWRAIFTTNFDDVAEQALKGSNALIVTPVSDARNLRSDRRPLYYLHGRARDFLDGVNDPSLVLSETNYLEIKDRNRNLYSALENEIHAASRIFFIGYSIRDAEIASRLFSIRGMASKSIVICGPSEKAVTLNRLKKFGQTFPIGVDKFATLLPDSTAIPSKRNDPHSLRFVSLIEPSDAKEAILSRDVERLLLSGEFDYGAFAAQQNQRHGGDYYSINRARHIRAIFEAHVNRFLVSSDLGNGKTVFLDQIAYEAHSRGYEVFAVRTQLPEALSELDELLSSNAKRLYLVDGFIRFRRAIRHIGKRLPPTSVLVCASGQIFDEVGYGTIMEEMGGTAKEVDLNILDSIELSQWDKLLERWG